MRFVLITLLLVFAGNAYAETKQNREFDLDAIAATLAKRGGHEVTPTLGKRAPQAWASDFTHQVARCWKKPFGGSPSSLSMSIDIHVHFKSDGSFSGEPEIVNPVDNTELRKAAAAALSAVKNCQPFQLPAEKYDQWKDFVATFSDVVPR